jgi:hypothetical protein
MDVFSASLLPRLLLGGTGGAAATTVFSSTLTIDSRLLAIDGDREWRGVLELRNCPLVGRLLPPWKLELIISPPPPLLAVWVMTTVGEDQLASPPLPPPPLPRSMDDVLDDPLLPPLPVAPPFSLMAVEDIWPTKRPTEVLLKSCAPDLFLDIPKAENTLSVLDADWS